MLASSALRQRRSLPRYVSGKVHGHSPHCHHQKALLRWQGQIESLHQSRRALQVPFGLFEKTLVNHRRCSGYSTDIAALRRIEIMLNCWTIVELLMALISWVNFNSPRKYFVCHNAQLTMLKACLPHDGLRFSRKCTIDFGIVNEIDAGANCSSQYFNLPTVRIPDFKHCELNNIYIYIFIYNI